MFKYCSVSIQILSHLQILHVDDSQNALEVIWKHTSLLLAMRSQINSPGL